MADLRRDFLRTSALTSMAAASVARVLGANDRIRIAVVGTGGRGQFLMRTLKKLAPDSVEFVAVCDVYDVRRAEAAAIAGTGVEQYLDYRQIMTRKDVDAVIVSTPDHWHSAIAVDALNSGKDVYIEKPMVHFPNEGQAVVKAARANKRIVQVGMQQRAIPQFFEAKKKYIDSGIMGKVGMVRTWYNSNSGYVQEPPPGIATKPPGLDWERWLGPRPKTAWDPMKYFSWYKSEAYGGGMIMGIAIHVLDAAHFWLGLQKPSWVMCGGGAYFYKNDRDTPDVVSFMAEYPQEVCLTCDAECLTAPGVPGSAGVELRGTGGVLYGERYLPDPHYRFTPNTKFCKEPPEKFAGTPAIPDNLLKNWLECMRSRKRPIANEDEGHYSAVACYMAMESYRKKTRIEWNSGWDLPA
jgi:predicted dehydrogenase